MFQSFTGNSRRPRQVNLSGQNKNPFAATGWGLTASGPHATVAAAQQERFHRHQERARLNAAKIIQRIWRGHKARRDLADGRRQAWDNLEDRIAKESPSPAILPDELRLLLSFFSPCKQQDIQRLAIFGNRVLQQNDPGYFSRYDVQPRLLRLTQISLDALPGVTQDDLLELILRFIAEIWKSYTDVSSRHSRLYYKNLSRIVTNATFSTSRRGLIFDAVRCPLVQNLDQDNPDSVLESYRAFGLELLTTPNLLELLDGRELARITDTKMLSVALLPALLSKPALVPEPDRRLWLVAHLIAVTRLQESRLGLEHYRIITLLLCSLPDELLARVDVDSTSALENSEEEVENEGDHRPPLPRFIVDQISILADKESMMSLFSRFDVKDINTPFPFGTEKGQREDVALLTRYALTLLRLFPRRADDIRMWLHYSSASLNSSSSVPTVRFIWSALIKTSTFESICLNTGSTLTILKSLTSHGASDVSSRYDATSQDWHIIMFFLELYAFGLRFTDDEEFLAGDVEAGTSMSESKSRFGICALPIYPDVKLLTLFLKNVAFALIFHASEILDNVEATVGSTLSTYLASSTSTAPSASKNASLGNKAEGNQGTNDIAGMAYSNVRELVVGVLRMLYERDSRRSFLPTDHWLMTSKFDMGNFITAVVAEEERRHNVDETDDQSEGDDDDDEKSDRQTRIIGTQSSSRAATLEKNRRQQRKLVRKRALASINPRLEILQNMPFVIPFHTRVEIFEEFVLLDKQRRRGGFVDPDQWRMSVMMNMPGPRELAREALGRHHAKIRRGNIFEDAMDQFYGLADGLKEPIQITFVDRFNSIEAGIDGGGVTKEFLTSITNEAFRTTEGPNLFVTNEQNLLYPNPAALDQRKAVLRDAGIEVGSAEWNETILHVFRQYEFLGRIVGKCLYEQKLIDISFAGFFLLKWALSGNSEGYRANINDLRDLDEELYRGLLTLKNYRGDVEDFGLDFTIQDVISSPGEPLRTITRDLMPNASNTPVTKENRITYISLVTHHRLQAQAARQTQAFLRGLGQIIKPTWLNMFNQSELQTLIGGDSSELDIDDLHRHTYYGGVYQIGEDGLEHPTIINFWQVMKELDDSERRKVLKYVTSTPRAPLLGFKELNPRFSIRDAGRDESRLPSTSTCVNLLKLPRYSSKQILREKLIYAVNSGAGFDLS